MNTLYITIGFPGSGKSTWAESINNAIIISSDNIRKEVFEDINDQTHNTEVFQIMFNRTVENLKSGNNVIYDATNISRKYRIHLLNSIPKDVRKVAVLFATPIDICISRDANRERSVGSHVINRMYKSFQMPSYMEGFDEIQIIPADNVDYYETLLSRPRIAAYGINHDNPHHTTTLGKHTSNVHINALLIAEREGLSLEDSNILTTACLYHDIGKNKTKTFTDREGGHTDIAHYYGHESVSAYDYICGIINHNSKYTNDDIITIANLINLHMIPFDENAYVSMKKKLKNDSFWKLLDLLHEADVNGG